MREPSILCLEDGLFSDKRVGKVAFALGYSDYDVFLENDEGSRVYRCKKLF